MLARERIGAVIISGDGEIVDGILSERDIVRALGTRGVDCLDEQIQDLMTSAVVGCHPEDTAISVHGEDDRRALPPHAGDRGNRMIGVISIGDVVKARITEVQAENAALTEMIANSW